MQVSQLPCTKLHPLKNKPHPRGNRAKCAQLPSELVTPKHGKLWCSIRSRCHQVIPSPNCSNRSQWQSPYNCHLSAGALLVLMLLGNLGEPEWTNIACSRQILRDIVCQDEEMDMEPGQIRTHTVCMKLHILKDDACFIFKWLSFNKTIDQRAEYKCTYPDQFKFPEIKDFQFLFQAVAAKFSPILLPHITNQTFLQMFTYEKYFHHFEYTSKFVENISAEGFYVCKSDTIKIATYTNLFCCSNNSYIAHLFVCDGSVDCPNDNSDESTSHCCHVHANLSFTKHCLETHKNDTTNKCPALYFVDYTGNCVPYFVKDKLFSKHFMYHKHKGPISCVFERCGTMTSNISTSDKFICEGDGWISCDLLNDLYADCGSGANDEPELVNIMTTGKVQGCKQPSQLACRRGHSKCFDIIEICSFKLNNFFHLAPCRNGGHLEDCRDFECNMMFKCHDSYCIPWSYVCDSKWDCARGEDELGNIVCGKNSSTCDKLFRCKHAKHTCVHLGNICDAVIDCPLGDDELLCELNNIRCPTECQCFLFAISCNEWTFSETNMIYPHIFLLLSHSETHLLQPILQMFKNTFFLHVVGYHIKSVCGITFPGKLLDLHLQNNSLEDMKNDCFEGLKALKSLDLANNRISMFTSSTFQTLKVLQFLNLSSNPLNFLPASFIQTSKQIFMSLHVDDLQHINIDALAEGTTKIVDTNHFHICCIIPVKSKCNDQVPWFISCGDLLQSLSARIFLIVASVLIFVLNAMSVAVQVATRHLGKAFVVIVVTLNLSDSLIVTYLSLIWVSDMKYQGIFIVNEHLWRSSVTCFLAFGFNFWFCMITQLQVVFLTLSRYIIVAFPFNTHFKSTKFVTKSEICILIGSQCSSAILTLTTAFVHGSLPFVLCLPLVDPTDSVVLIKIVTWTVAITQVVTTIVVLVLHIMLLQQLLDSQKNVGKGGPSFALKVQLAIITLSSVLCWFPSGVVYITAMFLSQYPIQMIIWTTGVDLPINSITNPVLFTVTSIRRYIKEMPKSKTNLQSLWMSQRHQFYTIRSITLWANEWILFSCDVWPIAHWKRNELVSTVSFRILWPKLFRKVLLTPASCPWSAGHICQASWDDSSVPIYQCLCRSFMLVPLDE